MSVHAREQLRAVDAGLTASLLQLEVSLDDTLARVRLREQAEAAAREQQPLLVPLLELLASLPPATFYSAVAVAYFCAVSAAAALATVISAFTAATATGRGGGGGGDATTKATRGGGRARVREGGGRRQGPLLSPLILVEERWKRLRPVVATYALDAGLGALNSLVAANLPPHQARAFKATVLDFVSLCLRQYTLAALGWYVLAGLVAAAFSFAATTMTTTTTSTSAGGCEDEYEENEEEEEDVHAVSIRADKCTERNSNGRGSGSGNEAATTQIVATTRDGPEDDGNGQQQHSGCNRGMWARAVAWATSGRAKAAKAAAANATDGCYTHIKTPSADAVDDGDTTAAAAAVDVDCADGVGSAAECAVDPGAAPGLKMQLMLLLLQRRAHAYVARQRQRQQRRRQQQQQQL